MKGLKILFYDLEKLYRLDLEKKRGFKIDTSVDYSDQHESEKNVLLDSIYSIKYGIQPSDDKRIKERAYSCKCGLVYGSENIGMTCQECETEVKFKVTSNNYRGWFVIPNGIRVLSPQAIEILKEIIGVPNYVRLGDKNSEVHFMNLEENFETYIMENLKKKQVSNKLLSLFGMSGKDGKDNINEKLAKVLIDNKQFIFTNKIPVISKKVRPHTVVSHFSVSTITSSDLNKPYTSISTIIKSINDHAEAGVESLSTNWLRDKYREIYVNLEAIYGQIGITIGGGSFKQSELTRGKKKKDKISASSKTKMLRGFMFSFRVPYTARTLLNTSHNNHLIDSVTICYDVFRGIAREEIKTKLKARGYRMKDIRRIIDIDLPLSLQEKSLMDEILKELNEENYTILINRQPTIYEASTLAVNISNLTDINVIVVHPLLLSLIAGDIDGDVLTLMSIPDDIDDIKIMSPREYFLDYKGDISDMIKLVKDSQIHLYQLLDDDIVEVV